VPIKGVLLLTFFVLSLPACFISPFYGILLWTVVAFLDPQSSVFYWSGAQAFPWAVAVAVPTLSGFLLFTRGWLRRLMTRECALLGILWLWFATTSIISTNTPLFMHHSHETWYQLTFVSKILLMTFVMIAIVDSFDRLRILVVVMAGCFGFFVVKAVPFLILTGGAFWLYGPENSMIADNNDLGLALNMTLPLSFFLAQTEVRLWARWLFGFVFLVTIPSIFFTYSRGALLGLMVVLLVMLAQSKRRFLLIPTMAFGVSIAMLFAPPAWRSRMDPTRPDAIDGSAQSRLNAWRYARNLASDYPIAGGGFETFTPELFDRYAPNVRDIHGPHSIYFQILAEHGYVGLGIYLALIVSCLAKTFRIAKLALRNQDPYILRYACMFRFSLVGFLASGLFLGRAYFDYFYSIVACIVILEAAARQRWASWEPEDEAEPEHDDMVHQELLWGSGQ
jgi:probable O-glycosylation ligase (exosortase A-associated)